jgi:hypothetical protein
VGESMYNALLLQANYTALMPTSSSHTSIMSNTSHTNLVGNKPMLFVTVLAVQDTNPGPSYILQLATRAAAVTAWLAQLCTMHKLLSRCASTHTPCLYFPCQHTRVPTDKRPSSRQKNSGQGDTRPPCKDAHLALVHLLGVGCVGGSDSQ